MTFVQHSIGWLVTSQWLFGEVLVRLSQALHLCETCVEGHGGGNWDPESYSGMPRAEAAPQLPKLVPGAKMWMKNVWI